VVSFDHIPAREPNSKRVHVVIDTPAGSRNKYKFDEQLGVFRISRVLPQGLVFPHDFGSIPGTRAADGDALDVVVIGLPATFPGCLVTTRLIGVLRARQVERGRMLRNDRLIGLGETPVNTSSVRGLRDLNGQQLDDIAHFFESYNEAQGREFKIIGRGERSAAEAAVERAIRAYRQSRQPS
jgi:inorganic pyrophosphatase